MYSLVTINNVWNFRENTKHLDENLYCGFMWRELYELYLELGYLSGKNFLDFFYPKVVNLE